MLLYKLAYDVTKLSFIDKDKLFLSIHLGGGEVMVWFDKRPLNYFYI